MIDLIKSKINNFKTDKDKFNYLREFLQVLMLSIMDEAGNFRNLAFVGGTALRIIYKINRYSEDLDFSLIDDQNYDFDSLVDKLLRELDLRGFNVSTKKRKGHTAVQSLFFKFDSLLYETGLSPLEDEKLFIKFEIDTNPPQGFSTEFHSFSDPLMFSFQSFDKPSLMSGKLHAVLQRQYDKGRDYYDLLWYLLEKVEPNLILLNNSLKQSTGQDHNLTAKSWKEAVLSKLGSVDFDQIRLDVDSFLIYEHEVKQLSLENFKKLLY